MQEVPYSAKIRSYSKPGEALILFQVRDSSRCRAACSAGPMAVAIMCGLIVATALTLLALPAMYATWFRVKPVEPALAG